MEVLKNMVVEVAYVGNKAPSLHATTKRQSTRSKFRGFVKVNNLNAEQTFAIR